MLGFDRFHDSIKLLRWKGFPLQPSLRFAVQRAFDRQIQEKEMRAMEDRDPAVSRAKRRREILARLSRLFKTIRYISMYCRSSVIMKVELVYQIVASKSEMTDRREVEERLDLLKEVVPEWISEKVAKTGDVIICINKMTDLYVVREEPAEAK